MAASKDDYFMKVGNPGTATTLSAPGFTSGGTSITVASTTNWPTDTGVIFAIDTAEIVNGEQERVAGTLNVFSGTVSGATTINNMELLYGTAQDYAAGSLTRVYVLVSSQHNNRLMTGLLQQHNQDGTHGAVTATSVNATTLVSSGATLTTPKIVTSINDSNGNEVIKTPATASAVNEITVTNAATGTGPTISATGGDTNIDLNFAAKGTGKLKGVVNNLYNPYKFSAYLTANQTGIADATHTKVTFNAENFDTGSNFDTTAYRFTAPVAGFYQINVYVNLVTSASNGVAYEANVSLYKNGASFRRSDTYPTSAGTSIILTGNLSPLIQLAANDYLEVYVWQDVSANTTNVVGGALNSYFDGYLVSAA